MSEQCTEVFSVKSNFSIYQFAKVFDTYFERFPLYVI